jgi:PAS domain S-box-containing protein
MANKFIKEFPRLIFSYIVIFILIVVFITISVFNFFKIEREKIKSSNLKELEVISTLKSRQISEWYEGETEDAELITKSTSFIKHITDWVGSFSEEVSSELISELGQLVEQHDYEDILVYTPDLKNFIASRIESVQLDNSEIESALTSLKYGKALCTDIFRNDFSNKLNIDFISPVRNRQGEIIAVSIFRQTPDYFLYPLISHWSEPGETAETYIFRKEGDSIIYLSELRFIPDAILKYKSIIGESVTATIFAARGNKGAYEGFDYRNENVVAYVDLIKGTPWNIVSKIDLNEILNKSLFKYANPFVVSFAMVIILLLIFTQLLSFQRNKFYKKMLLAREEFKTTLESIGDAVITADTSGRVMFINPVAQNLTGWNEHNAIGKHIDDIFVILNEENRNRAENPIKKVIESGLIIGLANHTILVSKDGKEIPISDSGAPIHNESGQIVGVVLVFRDQTNERIQQREVLESKRELTTLMSNLQGIVYKCRNDKDWTMEFVSKGCMELTGYESWEIENSNTISYGSLIHPDDQDLVWVNVQKALKDNTHFQVEYRIITKNKEIKWVWEKGRGIYENNKLTGIEGFITDISDKKNIENALIESEEIFNHFLKYSPVYLFFKDKDIRSLKLSPNFEQMLGRPIDELIGKDMFDLFPGELAKKMIEDDKQILKDRATKFVEEELNGRSYLTVKFPIIISGEAKYLAGFTIDMTERKQTEIALKSSEHLFQTLAANSTVGIFRTDEDGNTIYVNSKWCELAGITEDEALGLGWLKSIHPDDRGQLLADWKNHSSIKSESSSQYRFLHADGEIVWVKGLAVPQFNESGMLVGYIGTITDITEIIKSEEKILSLSELVKESHIEIYILELETYKILYTNKEAEINIGYSSAELSSMTPADLLLSKEYYEDIKEKIKPLINGELNVLSFEAYQKRKDGTSYPIEGHLQIFNYEGRNTIAAFIRDISQRKKAEEELHNSNMLLRIIVDNIPDAVYMKDNKGRKIIANKADIKNCGFGREEEIIGKTDFDMFPKEIAEKFWIDDLRVIEHGEVIINREEKLVNLSGDSKWLLTSKIPYRDAKGNIIGLVGLGHDITRKKIAEEEMSKLSKTITQSPVSIIITNTLGRIEYVNPKFTEVTGYTFEEVLGKNPNILKSGNQNDEFYRNLWDTILAGKDWDGEFLNKKKNGDLYWENAKISPIINDEGAIINFVAIKEDITEKKRMLEELIEAKDKAEEGDKLKTSFLANMSHEIRTPLNSILGFSSFITSEEDLSPEEKKEFSSIINKSAESLLQIINDIIDISSLETGQLKIFSSQVLINPIIRSLNTVFARKMNEMNKSHIQLISLTQEETFVYADENRLIQIFTNLLNNSLKFTEKGEIRFGVEKINDSNIVFIVSDTGIGIHEEFQQAVFERFRQAEGTRTRVHGGNGLGLSIVKNLLELMGGSITLESEVGAGTKFRFILPKRK